MLVRARLFASFREAAEAPTVVVNLGDEPRVSDLLAALREQYPRLGPGLESAMVAVNLEYVPPDYLLRDDDEVAIIPPVSGGQQREL